MEQINLSHISRELISEGRHLKFAKMVRRLASIGSAQADLTAAADRMRLLFKLAAEDREGELARERNITAGALFAHAIILYARATATDSDNRDDWWGTSFVKGAFADIHRDAMLLRKNAIAHFGTGDHMPFGPMVEESLFLVNKSGASFLAFGTQRTQHQSGFDQAFLDLIEYTTDLAEKKQEELRPVVFLELRRIAAFDRSFVEKMKNATSDVPAQLAEAVSSNQLGRLTLFGTKKGGAGPFI